jgi:hypothetical protein
MDFQALIDFTKNNDDLRSIKLAEECFMMDSGFDSKFLEFMSVLKTKVNLREVLLKEKTINSVFNSDSE